MKNFTFAELHRYIKSIPANQDRISLDHHLHAGLPLSKGTERYHLTFTENRDHFDLISTNPGMGSEKIIGGTFTTDNDDEDIITIENGSPHPIQLKAEASVGARNLISGRLTRFPSDILVRFMAQGQLKQPTINDLFRYLQSAEETSDGMINLPEEFNDRFKLEIMTRKGKRTGVIIHRRKMDGQYDGIGNVDFGTYFGTDKGFRNVRCHVDPDDGEGTGAKWTSHRISSKLISKLFKSAEIFKPSVGRNAHDIQEVLIGILQPMVDASMVSGPTVTDLYALTTRSSIEYWPYLIESGSIRPTALIDGPDTTMRQVDIIDGDQNYIFTFLFRMCHGNLDVTLVNRDSESRLEQCSKVAYRQGSMLIADLRLPVSCDPVKAKTIEQLIAAITWNYILS